MGEEGGDWERHEHSRANAVTRREEKTGERCVWEWDYQILKEPRDSQTRQILNSPNVHSNQAPAGASPVPRVESTMRNAT